MASQPPQPPQPPWWVTAISEGIVESICMLTDAVYNAAAVINPRAFTLVSGRPQVKTITVGTARTLVENRYDFPLLVNIRLETTSEDLKQYLFLTSNDLDEPSQAAAPIVEWDGAPKTGVILGPGQQLIGDATAKTGVTEVNVVYTVMPLKGQQSWPARGVGNA